MSNKCSTCTYATAALEEVPCNLCWEIGEGWYTYFTIKRKDD